MPPLTIFRSPKGRIHRPEEFTIQKAAFSSDVCLASFYKENSHWKKDFALQFMIDSGTNCTLAESQIVTARNYRDWLISLGVNVQLGMVRKATVDVTNKYENVYIYHFPISVKSMCFPYVALVYHYLRFSFREFQSPRKLPENGGAYDLILNAFRTIPESIGHLPSSGHISPSVMSGKNIPKIGEPYSKYLMLFLEKKLEREDWKRYPTIEDQINNIDYPSRYLRGSTKITYDEFLQYYKKEGEDA